MLFAFRNFRNFRDFRDFRDFRNFRTKTNNLPTPTSLVMKIVCISDTHGKHTSIPSSSLPEGDVLVHCGDFSTGMNKIFLLISIYKNEKLVLFTKYLLKEA